MFDADEFEGCWSCIHDGISMEEDPCKSCYDLDHYERKDCVCDATIEEHIEDLKKLKSFHNGSYGADINFAIDIMRKHQKIIEIVNSDPDYIHHTDMDTYKLNSIRKVVEDGKKI